MLEDKRTLHGPCAVQYRCSTSEIPVDAKTAYMKAIVAEEYFATYPIFTKFELVGGNVSELPRLSPQQKDYKIGMQLGPNIIEATIRAESDILSYHIHPRFYQLRVVLLSSTDLTAGHATLRFVELGEDKCRLEVETEVDFGWEESVWKLFEPAYTQLWQQLIRSLTINFVGSLLPNWFAVCITEIVPIRQICTTMVGLPLAEATERLHKLFNSLQPPDKLVPPVSRSRFLNSGSGYREDEYYIAVNGTEFMPKVRQVWTTAPDGSITAAFQQLRPSSGVYQDLFGELRLTKADNSGECQLEVSFELLAEFWDTIELFPSAELLRQILIEAAIEALENLASLLLCS